MDGLRPECAKCGLFDSCRNPFMSGEGAERPKLVLVGEAPGRDEDRAGRPFVGPSGQLLRGTLSDLGAEDRYVYITNAVRCRPTDNKINDAPIKLCRDLLLDELRQIGPDVVVALGNSPLFSLTGRKGIAATRGRWASFKDPADPILGTIRILPTWHPAYVLRVPSVLEDFIGDLETAWRAACGHSPAVASVPREYHIVRTSADLDALLDAVEASDVLAWDIETCAERVAGKVPGPFDDGARVVCVQFSTRIGDGWLVPIDHAQAEECSLSRSARIEIVRTLLESEDCPPLRGQNLKYDTGFVRGVLGINPRRPVFDTFIAHHLLAEEQSQFGGNGLKEMAWKYTGMGGYDEDVEKQFPSFYKEMHLVPLEVLKGYACGDTDVTLRVEAALAPRIALEGLEDVLALELEKQDWLVNLELRGLAVDLEYNAQLLEAFPRERSRILAWLRSQPSVREAERWLAREAGHKSIDKMRREIEDLRELAIKLESVGDTRMAGFKHRSIKHREAKIAELQSDEPEAEPFNPNSAPQLRVLLFDILRLPTNAEFVTSGGDWSVAKGVVNWWESTLPAGHEGREVIEQVSRFKSLATLFSRYVEPIAGFVGTDGRIHPTFNCARASSYRLTSSDPNAQNFPRNDED